MASQDTSIPGNDLSKRYAAPAVEKALDILEVLASEPGGLTRTQIAKRLNRSLNEVFRIIATLERRGYLATLSSTDPASARHGEEYGMTLKLFELSNRIPQIRHLVSAALPVLTVLARHTGQSCHLSVPRETTVIVVTQVDAPSDLSWSARLGANFDVLTTSSGRVAVAFSDPVKRQTMLAALRDANGDDFDESRFVSEIAEIQAQGYEMRRSYVAEGVFNVSYPVIGPTGYLVGALTVPYVKRHDLEVDGDIEDVRKATMDAAASLSRTMGASMSQLPWLAPPQARERA